jgi:hypothetical protein
MQGASHLAAPVSLWSWLARTGNSGCGAILEQDLEPSSKCAATLTRRLACGCAPPTVTMMMPWTTGDCWLTCLTPVSTMLCPPRPICYSLRDSVDFRVCRQTVGLDGGRGVEPSPRWRLWHGLPPKGQYFYLVVLELVTTIHLVLFCMVRWVMAFLRPTCCASQEVCFRFCHRLVICAL